MFEVLIPRGTVMDAEVAAGGLLVWSTAQKDASVVVTARGRTLRLVSWERLVRAHGRHARCVLALARWT